MSKRKLSSNDAVKNILEFVYNSDDDSDDDVGDLGEVYDELDDIEDEQDEVIEP